MIYRLTKTELIGLEPLQDLVELIFFTAHIKGERTCSLIVVGEPETGKTEVMKKYRKNIGVIYRRKFTGYGMIKELADKKINPLFPKTKILGTLVCPDFNSLYTYKENTTHSTIDFLTALTEEGLSLESSYAIDSYDLKPYVDMKGGFMAGINTCNFFTAPSKSEKRKVRSTIYRGGWFSRNIVITIGTTNLMDKK